MKYGKANLAILAIAGGAFALRLLYVMLFEADLEPGYDPGNVLRDAVGIVNGEGYRRDHLLAYKPPLLPFYVAGVFWLFGTDIEIVRVTLALIGSGTCVLLFFIGKELCSTKTGLLSAAFAAVFPQFIRYSGELWSENLFLFLLLGAMAALLVAERRWPLPMRALAGMLLGLATLAREVGLFALMAFGVWYLVRSRGLEQSVRKWGVIALFCGLAMAPWTLRNYFVFGTLVPVSTNGGINFYIGNNPEATGEFLWRLPPGAVWNAESPKGRIELETSRMGYREGFRFIADDPASFLRLTARRIVGFYSPPHHNLSWSGSKLELLFRLVWLVSYVFFFVLAILIGPYLLRKDLQTWSLLYLTILFQSLPYFVTFVSARFQYAVVALFMILSAAVISKVHANLRDGRAPLSP